MPAGIAVYNDRDTVIIDERFFNYAFKEKRVLTFQQMGGPVSGGFGNQAYMTVAGDMPLVAFRCPYPVAACRARPVAGGFEFGWITRHGAGAPVGATIEVFIFDRPTGSGTYGLQVFDENNRLTYDSSYRYMRVRDYRTIPGINPAGQVRLGAGNYAYIMTRPGFRWSGVKASPSPSAPWQWACQAGFLYSLSDGYDIQTWNSGEGTYPDDGSPAPIATGDGTDIITVDVTGY